jgi:N-acyl-L-homoserine lactone synthetase
MIRDVWPTYLESLPMPAADDVWEVSRFGVHPLASSPKEALRQSQQATAAMFCALTELCIRTSIREIYTLYDHKIARVIRRIDCHPHRRATKC